MEITRLWLQLCLLLGVILRSDGLRCRCPPAPLLLPCGYAISAPEFELVAALAIVVVGICTCLVLFACCACFCSALSPPHATLSLASNQPRWRSSIIGGQMPVNADWIRLAPANTGISRHLTSRKRAINNNSNSDNNGNIR